ncbi:GTP cyclohydrolase I FolE [Oceanithermus sp.]
MGKRVQLEDSDVSFETAFDLEAMSGLARRWLELIGEDVDREGLADTPARVARAWAYLTRGYQQTLSEVVNQAVFKAEGSEMVVVKDIEFYSMCEHHMLPFFGRVHIGYIPREKILGLSKFARIVEMFSRRLQLQERLATQIADAIVEVLDPLGVGVVIEGTHLCMMMRGVEKQQSVTVTSAMRGSFRSDPRTRSEFLSFLRDQ